MPQRLPKARPPRVSLHITTRHFQDNLRGLLSLSERLSQHSAEAARQAGQSIGTTGDQGRS